MKLFILKKSREVDPDPPCVVFTAIRGFALASSRMRLIQHFLDCGWRVVAATAEDDYAHRLAEAGAVVEPVPFRRGGLAPVADARAIWRLLRVYRRYRPSLIHHFQAKPILFGNLVARMFPAARVVNTITGLGHAFVAGGLARHLAAAGYGLFLSRSEATIFQNPDDWQLSLDEDWLPADKAHVIVSSGVDLDSFRPRDVEPNGSARRVLMVGRLLWEKGVKEFVTAARQVKGQFPHVRFQLAGEWDPIHPDAVNRSWIESAVADGCIEFLGYLDDMPRQLRRSDLFVLPSYREGAPRVVLEAAASGLPVITTDVPGCRETVLDGETGFLIPPKDSEALAGALSRLLSDSTLRRQMGAAAREHAERKFDVHLITERYLSVYRDLGIEIS